MQQPGVIISATGEEDLLGRYMSTTRDEQHEFPKIPKGANFIALPEGDWQVYRTSPQWQVKQQANQISYLWDALIEHQKKWSRSFEQLSPVAKRDHRGYAACICANGNAAKYASSGVAWLCA